MFHQWSLVFIILITVQCVKSSSIMLNRGGAVGTGSHRSGYDMMRFTNQYEMLMSNMWDDMDDSLRPNGTDAESWAFRRWLNDKLRTYDKRVRPFFGKQPLQVKLGIWLISISSVNEANMEFTVEMYMHEFWQDPRLKFDKTEFGNRTQLTMPLEAPRFLWLPDTSFLNALRSQNPEVGSLSHLYYLKLYENGTVFYSRRVSVTAECQMDLTMYPFDRQACTLEISSYGLDTSDLIFTWTLHEKSIVKENIQLADFYAVDVMDRVINVTYVAGNFSVPQLCFILQRRSGFCYAQLFVPATAVVASSWISLWLESETQFSDMVAVILAIIFLSYTYNTIMPRVSYVKAMDIYLGGCFMFVFLSLVKLAIVKYMAKRLRKNENFALCNLASSSFEIENGCPPSPIKEKNESETKVKFTMNNNEMSHEKEGSNVAGGQQHAVMGRKSSHATPLMQKRKSTAALLKVSRVHDRYWKCAKSFHIGSQILFPILFSTFAVFFFAIYANFYSRGKECFMK